MAADQEPNPAQYLSHGITIAVGAGLGYLLGAWLDRHRGWFPWGTLTCTMLGVASGLYLMLKDALKSNRQ